MSSPLPDHTGFQITPTLHPKPASTTIDTSLASLPSQFTVCVIGASRGIGQAIGEAYAAAGASKIILTGRDPKSLEEAASQVRKSARPDRELQLAIILCDITLEDDVKALNNKISGQFGRLDVLVVNAGLWIPSVPDVTKCSVEDFQKVFAVDFLGCYIAAHHLIPLLLETPDGARAFVAISGGGAWMVDGPIALPSHCISKLAQVRLVEHIANQFKDRGLLASAVHPGHVWTDTSKLVPEFHEYLTDDVTLCGAFLVWLTKTRENRLWLSGRYLSATWDVDELLAMKQAITDKDMLKARMTVS